MKDAFIYTGLLNILQLEVDTIPLHCRQSNCCHGFEESVSRFQFFLFALFEFLNLFKPPPTA